MNVTIGILKTETAAILPAILRQDGFVLVEVTLPEIIALKYAAISYGSDSTNVMTET